MNPKFLLALLLAFGLSGCVHFRQPKEFKNRKMKEDPPLLNQAPAPALGRA
jgi:hypothetical protein